jgi:glycosyltransferase involved in cell wall biosynthesis
MIIGHIGVTVYPPLLSRRGGAIQRRILELAKAQRADGHEVVAVSVGDETRIQLHQGVQIAFLKCRLGLPLRHLEFQARAVQLLLRKGVDLIHFHSQPEGAALVGGRVPTVLSYDFYEFRGAAGRLFHGAYRKALLRFDQLLPCSDHCKETSSQFWGLPEDRTRTLYNGVDLNVFKPDPAAGARLRERLGLKGLVLVYVGRICVQKGSDLLLRAFAALRRGRPDLELVMAGPIGQFDQSEDPERWRERIQAVGARHLGAVEEEALPAVYNLADVFVMPTRQYEMFGMAAVEAQACGRPVVASDHGGLRETVPAGCGLLFESGSGVSLATALDALLDDPRMRERCGAEARRQAARFSWKEIARAAEVRYAAAALVRGTCPARTPATGQVVSNARQPNLHPGHGGAADVSCLEGSLE